MAKKSKTRRGISSLHNSKLKIFKEPLTELRVKFILTCHHITAILLLIMFVLLWSISYRTTMNKVNTALRYVTASVDADGRTYMYRKDTVDEDFRAATVGCAVFTVGKNGVVDYYNLYENFPFLYDYDDVEDVVGETIKAVDNGVKTFKLNGRRYSVYGNEDNGVKYYAFYDYSTEYVILRNSAIWYIVAYVCALVAVILLAYLLSEKAFDPIKSSIENERTLTANASHELKTPLTIISANLSVIQSEPNSTVADNKKWLDSIEDQVKRMNVLIMDMLELSRLEQVAPPVFGDVDISEVVSGAVLSSDALCYEKSIVTEERIAEGLTVNGDKDMLERLVLILLDNAVKYTPNGGRIRVELKEIGKKQVRLTVVNSGNGMSPADIEHVFDRFYKGDTARTQSINSSSFGLGLSIAKAICDKHGAEICCTGKEGAYTEFDVFFNAPKTKSTEVTK